MENLISTLQGDGIQRSNLYMTWDFTVASENSLAGRALAIRDARSSSSATTTPATARSTGAHRVRHHECDRRHDLAIPTNPILKQIDGELTNVPCYLHPNCQPGGTFNFQPPTGTSRLHAQRVR